MPSAAVRDRVVLVAPDGTVTGTAPKLDAHRAPGRLHLAISVVLFDGAGKVLLQQRAASKYHFPLVWANACCSHPQPGEDVAAAAAARVEEELGITVPLVPAGTFTYQATCAATGRVEHELDAVFVGELREVPRPDPAEVADLRLADVAEIRSGEFDGPLAPWLRPALELALAARPPVQLPR